MSDPYVDNPFPDIPQWPKRPKGGNDTTTPGDDGSGNELPLDVNFYFFLFW